MADLSSDAKVTDSLGSNVERIKRGWGDDVVLPLGPYAAVVKVPTGLRGLKMVLSGPLNEWLSLPKVELAERVFRSAVEKARAAGMEKMWALDYLFLQAIEPDRDLLLQGLLNVAEAEGIPIVGGEVAIHTDDCKTGGAVVFIVGFANDR